MSYYDHFRHLAKLVCSDDLLGWTRPGMPDFNVVKGYDLSGQRVVVAGGTQGIGAAIAILCARLGAAVAILGRNLKLGQGILDELKSINKDQPSKHSFIPADLSTAAETKAAARKIKEWSGLEKVDYLFMSQGGPPSTTVSQTEDNLDHHFAVQAFSRVVLPYVLLRDGSLSSSATVASIAGAGRAGDVIVDPDNVDGQGLGLIARLRNSAAIIDCFTKEFNIRYPPLRVLHLWPGPVDTDTAKNSNTPMAGIIGSRVAAYLFTRSADDYALIAVWTAMSDEAKGRKNIWSWGTSGNELRLASAAEDDVLRGKIWDKLVSLADVAA